MSTTCHHQFKLCTAVVQCHHTCKHAPPCISTFRSLIPLPTHITNTFLHINADSTAMPVTFLHALPLSLPPCATPAFLCITTHHHNYHQVPMTTHSHSFEYLQYTRLIPTIMSSGTTHSLEYTCYLDTRLL